MKREELFFIYLEYVIHMANLNNEWCTINNPHPVLNFDEFLTKTDYIEKYSEPVIHKERHLMNYDTVKYSKFYRETYLNFPPKSLGSLPEYEYKFLKQKL
jgi:hypothetical protein